MSAKFTKIEYVNKAEQVHNYFYDYSNTEYVNSKTKIAISCPIHGIFTQVAAMHLQGQGCPKCNGKGKTTEDIVIDFQKAHNNKYDYSLVAYKGTYDKIKIICPEHGAFEQTPNDHIKGRGCSKCGGSNPLTTTIFKERANIIHNNKFDYSLVNYTNMHNKVEIICPIHGSFEQIPKVHLQGFGCKNCNESRGEKEISTILKNKNINFIRQHSFIDCRHKLPLPFDFYLSELNICIEFQGIQHYQPVELFGGEQALEECKARDDIKAIYCRENNIKLVTIKYTDNINNVLDEAF